MRSFELAVGAVQEWLLTISDSTPECSALVKECLDLVRTSQDAADERLVAGNEPPVNFFDWIDSPREALVELAASLRYCELRVVPESCVATAYLADSFARSDDLQGAAIMLELGERAAVGDELLAEVWEFVLNQQSLDGAFGLISAELSMLGRKQDQLIAKLTLTREVLRAMQARARTQGRSRA